MKKIFLAILFLISFSVVIAQFTPPSAYTTYYRFRMWNQSASPGADSLNKNSIDIDKAIHDRQLGIDTLKNITLPTSYWSKVALDTTQFVWKGDTAHYFTKYNFDTSAVPYKSDTLHYFSTYNFDTSAVPYKSDTLHYYTTYNFDTLKNFYRRDTIKYYSVYNLDTASKMTYAKDSSHLAHTDTLTTEDIRGKWNFWNIVRFIGIVTFDVSPVFNVAVNFANGINVTGNATVSGDLVLSGWTKNASSLNRDQYEKVKIVRVPLVAYPPYVATTFTAAHGITNWRTVTGWTCLVQEDSLNQNIYPNVLSNDAGTANVLYDNASVDSINVRIRIKPAAVNLFNDTAKFRITYSDYAR
jgi:hypothetical protein